VPANSVEAAALALGSCGVIRDGVLTRRMDTGEFAAWNYALLLTSIITDKDRLQDRLCEIANKSEAASLRAEQRGIHDEASWQWLRAELFDAAARGLVR
jgi:hypothetical protein